MTVGRLACWRFARFWLLLLIGGFFFGSLHLCRFVLSAFLCAFGGFLFGAFFLPAFLRPAFISRRIVPAFAVVVAALVWIR